MGDGVGWGGVGIRVRWGGVGIRLGWGGVGWGANAAGGWGFEGGALALQRLVEGSQEPRCGPGESWQLVCLGAAALTMRKPAAAGCSM